MKTGEPITYQQISENNIQGAKSKLVWLLPVCIVLTIIEIVLIVVSGSTMAPLCLAHVIVPAWLIYIVTYFMIKLNQDVLVRLPPSGQEQFDYVVSQYLKPKDPAWVVVPGGKQGEHNITLWNKKLFKYIYSYTPGKKPFEHYTPDLPTLNIALNEEGLVNLTQIDPLNPLTCPQCGEDGVPATGARQIVCSQCGHTWEPPRCTSCEKQTIKGDHYRFAYGNYTGKRSVTLAREYHYAIAGRKRVWICHTCFARSFLFSGVGLALAAWAGVFLFIAAGETFSFLSTGTISDSFTSLICLAIASWFAVIPAYHHFNNCRWPGAWLYFGSREAVRAHKHELQKAGYDSCFPG